MQRPGAPVPPEAQGEVASAVVLSEEEQVQLENQRQERADKLDAIGLGLAKLRSEAINARESSGIEDEWLEDEEHYEGIDDANRGEMASWRSKPPGQQSMPDGAQVATTSTVFPNITAPYVDSAAARVSDMLLPTDDRAWSLGPTPAPELVDIKDGRFPKAMLKEIAAKHPGNTAGAKNELAVAVEAAMEVLDEAREKAEKAQKRIEDWHVECQFHAEVRTVIEDSSRIGTGVLKGPTPAHRRQIAFKDGKLIVKQEIKPGSKRISAWNLYPDGACGENIHNGSYIWEKDDLTRKQLENLKGLPGYIDDQIDKCLEEGPGRASKTAPEKPEPDGRTPDRTNLFEVWYFHGTLSGEELVACGCKFDDGQVPMSVPCQVTMVNNRVIKAIMNPLDTGEFPYDVMVWRKRSGHWAGTGVARQIRVAQRMVVAATRNMMDNAGRGGGPQVVILQGKVTPHDGVYEVTPWKVWLAAEDSDLEHIDNAFRFVEVPMVTEALLSIIQFALKMAEDVTGLPLLLQGQQGKAPDTLGGMQMLNNNASTVLRRIARLFDDRITEPHVRRYYAFLLQYGEDDEKGDFVIDARGSSALVERDLQNQAVVQMGPIVKDPAFGIDPRKWFAEYCKSQRLDAKRFQYTEDEQKKIDEMAKEGPVDPRIAVAQIRSAHEERLKAFDGELRKLELMFEERENERDRQFEFIVKELEQSGAKEISLDKLKGMLAQVTITTQTQRDLSKLNAHARQVAKPPTEPAGRADKGKAYQQ